MADFLSSTSVRGAPHFLRINWQEEHLFTYSTLPPTLLWPFPLFLNIFTNLAWAKTYLMFFCWSPAGQNVEKNKKQNEI